MNRVYLCGNSSTPCTIPGTFLEIGDARSVLQMLVLLFLCTGAISSSSSSINIDGRSNFTHNAAGEYGGEVGG